MSSRRDRAEELRHLMETEGDAIGENTRTVNQLTDYTLQRFEKYEDCRDAARDIKERAIADLPDLIDTVTEAVEANGGQVHVAQTAADANRIAEGIMADHDAEKLVKSKSMTTEEIDVNDHLEAAGYEVVETDLGEFVIQVADESPSHLIGPAMHRSADEIAALFNREFDLDEDLDGDPHELTEFARERVGDHIREADVGMTGANFVVAESGTLMLVTNEGNARKTAVTPDTHIAVAGVEKLVPSLADLQPFTELIAKTGTGQDITSYVSLLTPPVDAPIPDFEADEFRDADERSFHLILLDNGRMAMREDDELRETLYCIRCGACNNSCANFQSVGGHGFGGETYTGGIGTGWEAGVHGLDSASDMNDLCTGCSRCVPKCPVKIDIPWINTVVRERLNHQHTDETDLEYLVDGLTPDEEPAGMDRQKRFFGNVETVAKLGSLAPGLTNALASFGPMQSLLERLVGVDSRRALPDFADETLREWYGARGAQVTDPDRDVVLYPDLYTDYFDPDRGKAAVRVLETLGCRVHVPAIPESGRAPLSQGMIETAREQAEAVHGALVTHLDQGRDVVVIEPSDLAMFRSEYEHLLPERSFDRLADDSYELMEYVYGLLENGADADRLGDSENDAPIAYHSHCQQRTLGLDEYTTSVLDAAGYDVRTSTVECCGMAGSFGYKREYYEMSMDAGEALRDDLGDVTDELLVASGTSCQEQLDTLYERRVPHPIEVLASGERSASHE
ncbi:LUD domain-containing protein [Halorientalis brevis]|uniref:LUD domain-containing protein n=1 Tax=Halorientalis brevis TaxID=1126241 RepID=A0ABD6CG53_9EURY|nr:LUD domain-containing protein [Halorientalis brevis]